MMVSTPAAGAPYAAAAALDRALRSGNADGGDASASESQTLAGGPDVVVTLSQGVSPPSTYGPSGRMGGTPTLDELGANGPHSMAKATESAGTDNASAPADAGADANAGADTAVAA